MKKQIYYILCCTAGIIAAISYYVVLALIFIGDKTIENYNHIIEFTATALVLSALWILLFNKYKATEDEDYIYVGKFGMTLSEHTEWAAKQREVEEKYNQNTLR
jgi:hypothetical protein